MSDNDVNALVDEYYSLYDIILDGRDPEEFRRHVAVQARIEIGMERFMVANNYHAVVTHFDDLESLQQLPGLAIQRLEERAMALARRDWKTAAMVRVMKLMTAGIKNPKGTSMLEDYTYNMVPGKEGILQAHAGDLPLPGGRPPGHPLPAPFDGQPGGPGRLVFTSKTGPGIAVS